MENAFELIEIPDDDKAIIAELIDVHPGRGFGFYIERIKKIFVNPTPYHYMTVAFLIGYSQGATNTERTIINNLKKWTVN